MIAWETGTIGDPPRPWGHGARRRWGRHTVTITGSLPGSRTVRPLDAGDDVKYPVHARRACRRLLRPRHCPALAAFRQAHGLSDEAVAGREVWSLIVTTPAATASRRRRWWPVAMRAAR